jgi:outer membrane receptor protein involved in Fe transport
MNPNLINRFCRLVALSLALAGVAFGQGITTSAISGFVTDKQGAPVSGATITAVHEPSGTRSITTSRANGQYNFSGLRVGGPYTITATGAQGTLPDSRKELYLELGQTLDLGLKITSEIVQMEAFRIQGERDTTFDAARMGGGTSFNDDEIINIASVRSDVQDIARLDSRLTLTSLDQGGQMSAQGQNFRFNSFLIDGVEANDPFGLNGSGVATLRSPIPLEALAALNIELNPYDVRRSNFTGALINAVTKSGSNRFEGALFYEFSNDDMRGKNPRTGAKEALDERRYGINVSGPILRDRLFFSFTYEDFERESAPPSVGFVLTPASRTLVDQVIARARALGYDPGTLDGTANNIATQKTYLGKLDWNISESHRVTASYRQNEGVTPVFPSVTSATATSLSNYWYDQPRNSENYTAQLFSQWTPDFRTELTYSNSKYEASPQNRGAPFPSIRIGGLQGTRTDTNQVVAGNLDFGTEFSRQMNLLSTKTELFKISGEYSIGDHTFVAGGEVEIADYDNRFLQAFYGSYTFNALGANSGVQNWLTGTPTAYTDAQPFAGRSIDEVFAKWTYKGYALYLQDTWRPNQKLTVTGGIRWDMPEVSNPPPTNAPFAAAFGVRNDTTNDGNYTISPRVGFNYRLTADRKTELRGGLGLFNGRTPTVWLGNAYQNAGTAGTIAVNVNGAGQPTLAFQPDVTRQPIPAGSPPTPTINLIDPEFKNPTLWKGNLALDHTLPFGNLIASLEFTATKVHEGLYIEFLNYQTATTGPATMPDGRIRYAGAITPGFAPHPFTNTSGRRRIGTFADVYRITNSSEGHSEDVTLSLFRPMRNRWSAGVSWTRGRATEVSPMTSSTAGSLYTTRAIFNPNENRASTSNTETGDKIVARYHRRFEFIKNWPTDLTLVYEGRTGRTYSWVFEGDANGDGFAGNDLLYVPSGPSDPRVRWTSTAERDAFFAFAAESGLSQHAGRVTPRNSERSPWTQTVDLTLRQAVPLGWRNARAEVYLQMINFANLLNDNWGMIEEVPFTYRRTVAGTLYDPVTNQYVYTFNNSTLDGVPTVADETSQSRWQAKLGMTIRF